MEVLSMGSVMGVSWKCHKMVQKCHEVSQSEKERAAQACQPSWRSCALPWSMAAGDGSAVVWPARASTSVAMIERDVSEAM